MIPDDLLYTKEHEWIRVDGDKATIGITEHAQDELGDVVFVELPTVGDAIEANEPFGSVESVKAVSELFMPVGGEVVKVNPGLEDAPELVNDDPYGKGWMIRVTIKDKSELDELLSSDDYDEYISKGEPGE
jgi:glycine cleavage system H protein